MKHPFSCPYCSAPNTASVDPEAGTRQYFFVHCPRCARTAEIEAEIEPDGGLHFVAKRTGEG